MTVFVGVQIGGCTAVVVPGWAAVGVVVAAAAPRALRATAAALKKDPDHPQG